MNPPRVTLSWLTGSVVLFTVGVFYAQTPPEDVFHHYDRNGDGKVSPEELPQKKAFVRFDLNQDGFITLEEYTRVIAGGNSSPMPPSLTGKEFAGLTVDRVDVIAKQLDKNGDGRITREEAGTAPWFGRLDTNADNVLDATEIAALKERLKARAAESQSAGQPTPPFAPETLETAETGLEILKPGDVGVGRMIPDVAFTDISGATRQLSDFHAAKGLVIAMTSASCPVSKRYLPRLAEWDAELAKTGFALVLVNPFGSETPGEVRAQLEGYRLTAPYVTDGNRTLSEALGARTTTEVFLLDSARTLVYRGALDDQYGLGHSAEAPRHLYLRSALDALQKGERPAIAATAAPGCELDLGPEKRPAKSPVTYHRDVARILQQHCVDCHRDGGIAPFSLEDFDAVRDRLGAIRRVVSKGSMPPWFAAAESDSDKSRWANDCSLSLRDKTDLLAWIDSPERPAGDPAHAPVKRRYPSEWSIGTPDLVVPLSRAYEIKAEGFMPYQFDVVHTELTEEKWVSAYEILPSERDVVHHVIVKVHEKGDAARDREEGAEGFWAAYVPGNGSRSYPEGFARRLPAGAKISFQIHYTPSGKAKRERLRLGLVFAPSPPRFEVKTASLANRKIAIPPGAADHLETWVQHVPFDMPVMSFMAHMHVRGKSFKFEYARRDGPTETLLDIPHYDFNWQLRYDLKSPVLLTRGSTVKISAIYDNSPANKANPDPNKLVKWGAQTVDEMMIGYLEYFQPTVSQMARR